MKRIVFIFLFFLVCYFIIIGYYPCKNKDAKIFKINNKDYCLLTADNQKEWARGLMFYKKPTNFDGMIFLFPNKETKSFWNKNTYVDLDIYWMNDDKIVGKSFLPSILNTKEVIFVESTEKVNRVVEIIK